MTGDRIRYSIRLVAICIVVAIMIFLFGDDDQRQNESISVLETDVKIEEFDKQIKDVHASNYSASIDEVEILPEEVSEHELIGHLLENLSEEERAVLELTALQASISKRVNDLSPGSMSEEEMAELFDDIDLLDENAVFLGKEAEQLKIYVKSAVSY